MKKPKLESTTPVVEETPKITTLDLVRAATNDPALSTISVTLGDKDYPVVDLPYDAYIRFLALLQPLLEVFASKLTGGLSGSSTGALSAASIIQYCSSSLPEMALIVVEQTDPDITIEQVKVLGKTPFKLAAIVIKQIEANKMITEISDFFVQLLPLMKMSAAKTR